MYNNDRKEKYLKLKTEGAIIANNVSAMFIDTEKHEEKYGKDVCDWTAKEALDYYRYLSTNNVQTLILINTALKEYSRWCLINNLIKDNQNHFDEITTDALCKCTNINGLKERVVMRREDFINLIDQLPNYTDRFIFLGLYEGLTIEDLCQVKMSNLENNILHLNNRDISISNKLVYYMRMASDETEYISGKRTYTYQYGEEIIRPFDGNGLRGVNVKPLLIIGTRIRRCSTNLGVNLTVKNIREAGRLNYLKEIIEKNNISKEKAVRDYRQKHEYIYGKIQNIKVYLEIYGDFLDLI